MSVINTLIALMEKASPTNKAVAYFMSAYKTGKLKEYKKFGAVTVEKVKLPTKVHTIIDGKIETVNTAKPGEYIVTGIAGETYVLTAEKLKSRYKKVKGNTYEAIGECYAIQYVGKPFKFKAPWGEDMLCENGDYICSTALDGSDVYRIEKEVFKKTYKLKG